MSIYNLFGIQCGWLNLSMYMIVEGKIVFGVGEEYWEAGLLMVNLSARGD